MEDHAKMVADAKLYGTFGTMKIAKMFSMGVKAKTKRIYKHKNK